MKSGDSRSTGEATSEVKWGRLLASDYRRSTITLTLSFLTCLTATYLVFNWLPSELAATGHDLGQTSLSLAAFNIGGVVGAIAGATLRSSIGSRPVMAMSTAVAVAASGTISFSRGALADPLALTALLVLGGAGIRP